MLRSFGGHGPLAEIDASIIDLQEATMRRQTLRTRLLAVASATAILSSTLSPAALADPASDDARTRTATPIKHAIIIVGENRSFDHLFATYRPHGGQTVDNLLARGIIKADGSPGPYFAQAAQRQASVTSTFAISPAGTPYATLPPPNTGGTAQTASDSNPPPFATLAAAQKADYGLEPQDARLLTTGASGLAPHSIDTRIKNAGDLPSGPFQLSPGAGYDDYAASPVHRFYQMWQQTDCSAAHATQANPSGCLSDLFPWVEVSVGAGSNGKPQPAGFNDETTGEGATSMGFYNVLQGDVPYFTQLAQQYAIADNYHQPVMGGTGANSIVLGYADLLWYSDGKGHAATPPQSQIENPDPQPGTNNYYAQDGYSGGSYTDCSDTNHPGVAAIVGYLQSLPYKPKPNCQPGHYYLLNNYNPGYFGDGTVDTTDTFTIPPSPVRSIADELNEKSISWRYYGEGWNQYVKNPQDPTNVYCNICNPFQYETAIMTNAAVRQAHLKDTLDLYSDIQNGSLPAVAYVKPGALNDGHPTSSKFDIFEAFTKKTLDELKANPKLAASTAVFITVDEGGGYWDSGYIQPLDYFGDGTRIPLIVVSPFSHGGRVVHSYSDHASIVKFIEKNWGLGPITSRSRDNLPNPVPSAGNPYVPANAPAISDLMDMFNFGSHS
jgi:phospholipase C